MRLKRRPRGFIRDSLLSLGAFASSGTLFAQVAGALPPTDLAAIVTQGGVLGVVIYLLVQSYRERQADSDRAAAAAATLNGLRVDEAKQFGAELQRVNAEQTARMDRLLTAVLDRLPAAEDSSAKGKSR